MTWSDPFASFDAAALTSNTDGVVLNLDGVFTDHAVQYTVSTGTSTDVTFKVQGSLDGANWYDLGISLVLTSSTSLTTLQVVSLKPAQYLRVNAVVSGTVTVTALLTSR